MHPIVERYLAGQLPEPMAQALVTGSLPVPPGESLLAQAYAILQGTPLAERALNAFQGMPDSVLQGVLLERLPAPAPLALVLRYRKDPALLEAALLHPDLSADIVEATVASLPGSVLEIVLNNQVLWMQRPGILDQLEAHPEGDYHLKRRINEFRFDVLKQGSEEAKQDRLEILDEVEAGKLDKAWAELPMPKEEPEAAEEAPAEEELLEVVAKADHAAKVAKMAEVEINLSVARRIMKLRTNQKIMLAIKGGKEERTILIRSANRLIQANVMKNPRITEAEVAYIANMRTVNEEVLRLISMNREWMKKYPIVKSLVYNPRTPLPLAMSQLKRILEPDLKMMMKDKNVPELLRREAKRMLEMKAEGKG